MCLHAFVLYMLTCLHVCMFACRSVHVFACFAHLTVYISICLYVYRFVLIDLHVHMFACIWLCICICILFDIPPSCPSQLLQLSGTPNPAMCHGQTHQRNGRSCAGKRPARAPVRADGSEATVKSSFPSPLARSAS